MAGKLLQHALLAEPEPLRSIEVRSAGLCAFPGDAPSANSVEAMKRVGLDISDHRSSPLSDQLLEISDLILGMTQEHLDVIREDHPKAHTKLRRYREWITKGPQNVPDPFGGSLDLYIETRDSLAEAIPSIMLYLKSLLHEN
jgi:protein-tyrosine-phosphatase